MPAVSNSQTMTGAEAASVLIETADPGQALDLAQTMSDALAGASASNSTFLLALVYCAQHHFGQSDPTPETRAFFAAAAAELLQRPDCDVRAYRTH